MFVDNLATHAEGVVVKLMADEILFPQDARDQVRADIERTVRDAVQAARDGQEAAAMQETVRELERALESVAEAQGGAPATSVLKDGQNRIVVRTQDGRTIVVDPLAVPDPEAQQAIIAQAIARPRPPEYGLSNGVLELSAIFLTAVTVMFVAWMLARVFGRRAERRGAASATPPDVAARLDRIEQAVEAMSIEMERVSEAQRYSARLLTERLPDEWPRVGAGGNDAASPARSAAVGTRGA